MKFPLLAGLSATLFVSGMAHGEFTGLRVDFKGFDPNQRLLILNLFLTFDDPGDRAIALNGFIPALGQPQMFFRTNASAGFHQETAPLGVRDFAIDALFLTFFPNYANDTYFNVGIKSGQVTAGGVESGTDHDNSLLTPSGILFDWNGGGKQLASDPTTGGSFDLVDVFPPISDQNIAGATPSGNQIFIAQFVLDGNSPTNDGFPHHVYIQIGNLIWQDAAGNNHVEGFDPSVGAGCPLIAIGGPLTPCFPPVGDVNSDLVVNVLDLIQLLLDFGAAPGGLSDVDCNGTVNVLDLIDLLLHFGCHCFNGCPPFPSPS